MSIEFWIVSWKVLLLAAIAAFAVLAVVVTLGGFFDILRLLKTLREEHARSTKKGEETAQGDSPNSSR